MKDSLSLRVHAYIKACRRAKYEFPKVEEVEISGVSIKLVPDEPVEFGEVDELEVRETYKERKRELAKAERARKKQLKYLEENKDTIELSRKRRGVLRASLNGQPASKKELARLREQAKQAMLEASRRASEPVMFCCGAIRPVSYECPVNRDHGVEVLEVNSWA